jgi:hypothetical protein
MEDVENTLLPSSASKYVCSRRDLVIRAKIENGWP